MGADIHPFIEWRKTSRSPWVLLREIKGTSSGDGDPLHGLCDRSYWRFSILAGVRNGMDVTPLFADRGIPKDASDEVKAGLGRDRGIHSPTYCTVQELLDQDWDEVACIAHLLLPAGAYLRWLEGGRQGFLDDHFLADPVQLGMANHGIELIGEHGMMLMLMAGSPDEISPILPSWLEGKKKHPKLYRNMEPHRTGAHVRVASPVTYRQMIPDFIDGIVPELAKLGNPKNTRIVFGFDS